jgi:hypothetical protein
MVRKLPALVALLALALIATTACASTGSSRRQHRTAADAETITTDVQPTAAPSDDDDIVQPPIAQPSCPEGPSVHFDTPEAAMTYLASAWNRNDLAALCQVTNPNARFLLNDMHNEAVNLRLKKCDKVDVGHYSCTFRHDYPAHMHKTGTGSTWLDVAPADDPGWYMTVFEGCG